MNSIIEYTHIWGENGWMDGPGWMGDSVYIYIAVFYSSIYIVVVASNYRIAATILVLLLLLLFEKWNFSF